MKESEIRLIPLDVGELGGAMESNRIDAFSAWEPTVSAVLSRHKDFKAIHRFLNSNYLYQTRQFAQRHPDASLQIHASFVRSLHWMNASNKNLELAAKWSLQAAEKMTGRKPELSEEQLARVTSEGISRIARSPVIPQSDFKRKGFLGRSFEFLKNQGNIPANTPWEKIRAALDNKMVKAVLADPAKYKLDNFYPELDK
jgi:ABC-type nitrate/sulfonate/bicarbonate transport system substrate-binding protein